MVNIRHSQRSTAAGKQLRSWPTFDDDAAHVVHLGQETQQRAGIGHGVSGFEEQNALNSAFSMWRSFQSWSFGAGAGGGAGGARRAGCGGAVGGYLRWGTSAAAL